MQRSQCPECLAGTGAYIMAPNLVTWDQDLVNTVQERLSLASPGDKPRGYCTTGESVFQQLPIPSFKNANMVHVEVWASSMD